MASPAAASTGQPAPLVPWSDPALATAAESAYRARSGFVRTAGTVFEPAPPSDEQLAGAFEAPHSSKALLSVGARALSKHAGRHIAACDANPAAALAPLYWSTPKGSESAINALAREHLTTILRDAVWRNVYRLHADVLLIEVRLASGHGMRWTLGLREEGGQTVIASIAFRGYVEPGTGEEEDEPSKKSAGKLPAQARRSLEHHVPAALWLHAIVPHLEDKAAAFLARCSRHLFSTLRDFPRRDAVDMLLWDEHDGQLFVSSTSKAPTVDQWLNAVDSLFESSYSVADVQRLHRPAWLRALASEPAITHGRPKPRSAWTVGVITNVEISGRWFGMRQNWPDHITNLDFLPASVVRLLIPRQHVSTEESAPYALALPPQIIDLELPAHCVTAASIWPASLVRLTLGQVEAMPPLPASLRSLRFSALPVQIRVDPSSFRFPPCLTDLCLPTLSARGPLTQWHLPDTLTALELPDYFGAFCGVCRENATGLHCVPCGIDVCQSADCMEPHRMHTKSSAVTGEVTRQWVVPPLLRSLLLPARFNSSLAQMRWPLSLTQLDLGPTPQFDHSLDGDQLPPSLVSLQLDAWNRSVDAVVWPRQLMHLTLGGKFNQPVSAMKLPPRLQTLDFSLDFDQDVHSLALPDSLTALSLNGHYPALKYSWHHVSAFTRIASLLQWRLPAGLQRLAIPDPKHCSGKHPLRAEYAAFVQGLQARIRSLHFLTVNLKPPQAAMAKRKR